MYVYIYIYTQHTFVLAQCSIIEMRTFCIHVHTSSIAESSLSLLHTCMVIHRHSNIPYWYIHVCLIMGGREFHAQSWALGLACRTVPWPFGVAAAHALEAHPVE